MTVTSTSSGTDLWRLGAAELAVAIRRRQVSVREVVEAHLRRIDAADKADRTNGCAPPSPSRSAGPTCPPTRSAGTDSELWGETINPWDRTRTPGAASGGEAVALATGMSPFGLGNDTLGSLPWPAQCCGVTALKPTSAGSPTVCARPRRTVDRT